MYRKLALIALLACLPNASVLADPIHARPDGAYWHHDSGWIFPEKIGMFMRVGIPQDVAGSEDAVAHYAFEESGTRYTAAVDVYRATSAAAAELEAPAAGASTDTAIPVSAARGLSASRKFYDSETPKLGVYIIDAGEWRVRIRVTGSQLSAMDAFVLEQRWESLSGH